MSVEYYVDKFGTLNMNRQNGRKSPHKVCLLLAVMELIQAGHIHSNRIELNDTLKERFTQFFKRLHSGNDNDTPELPFFPFAERRLLASGLQRGRRPRGCKGPLEKGCLSRLCGCRALPVYEKRNRV